MEREQVEVKTKHLIRAPGNSEGRSLLTADLPGPALGHPGPGCAPKLATLSCLWSPRVLPRDPATLQTQAFHPGLAVRVTGEQVTGP